MQNLPETCRRGHLWQMYLLQLSAVMTLEAAQLKTRLTFSLSILKCNIAVLSTDCPGFPATFLLTQKLFSHAFILAFPPKNSEQHVRSSPPHRNSEVRPKDSDRLKITPVRSAAR